MTRRQAWTLARAIRDALPPDRSARAARVTSAGNQVLLRIQLDHPDARGGNYLFTAAELESEPPWDAP